MTYDWKVFTARSDRRYGDARRTGDFGALKAHNILANGEVELRFIADVIRAHSGKDVSKGRALDVCCGSGYMSSCLAAWGYSVLAFDMNADAIQIARETYPGIAFLVDDAAVPSGEIAEGTYDLILIPEAHPFSRVRDDEYQRSLVHVYMSMLTPKGVLAIGHARRGGGMNYRSMSFEAVEESIRAAGASAYGPYFMFLYKHFRPRGASRSAIVATSIASNITARLTNSRWIEYFIVHRL